jgi:hypothetical protein
MGALAVRGAVRSTAMASAETNAQPASSILLTLKIPSICGDFLKLPALSVC